MARRKSNAELQDAESAVYNKEQILKSRKYAEKKDLLSVLLLDSRDYPLTEVDALIDGYMKGKVE